MKWNSVKQDGISSLVVFLVAIPLCLGIALASGASFLSGMISGIIGGIIVGYLSDSHVSVSGPAAGMIAIVLMSTIALGSFQAFLFALVVAGILQMIIGSLRAGFIADYVPSSVIQGLLAAIGILIIIKQLPLAFGLSTDAMHSLKSAQEAFSLIPLIHLFHHVSVPATIIALCSMLILLTWEKLSFRLNKIIPAPIIAVVVSILISIMLTEFSPHLALTSSLLVNITVSNNFQSLINQLSHPVFNDWNNMHIYLYGGVIAAVASLETLLNLEAAEKLDPHHRYCSRNKELVAQGVGNVLSGLIGGLPITSVIVRTSVNIQARNRTKLSTILHGFLLLFSLIFIPTWLNKIPLAALATILIVTGYKLARISLFRHMYRQGKATFSIFIVTVLAIVFTNLLLGILIGLSLGLFFILHQNSRHEFLQVKEKHTSGEVLRFIFPQQLSFLNKAAILNVFKKIPNDSKVIFDAKNTNYIDNDILEIIKQFKEFQAPDRNIALNLMGLKPSYHLENQTNFITATTLDVQNRLTQKDILQALKEGNQRFINNTPIHKDFKWQIKATSEEQHPIAVVLSCIDSRVPVEHIFDLNLGEVFVARIAGNIVNLDILASIEFACEIAGAKLIIVLGHRRCGAVTAACEDIKIGHLSQLLEKLKPAISIGNQIKDLHTESNLSFVDRVACINIDLVKNQLCQNSENLNKLLLTRKVGIVGAMYDLTTGRVTFDKLQMSPTCDIQAAGSNFIKMTT